MMSIEDDHYSQLTLDLIADWSCSQCTLENLPSAISCSACGASRSLNNTSIIVHQPAEEGVVEFQPKPGTSVLTGNRELLWTCPRCTCKNDEDRCLCQACGFRAINVLEKDTVTSPEPSAQSGGIASSIGNMIKKKTSEKSLPDGDIEDRLWTCTRCTFNNHHDLLYCEQCRHTPGTEDVPIIPNDYLKPVAARPLSRPKAPPPRPNYQPERKKPPSRPELPPERPKQTPITRSVSTSRTGTASKPARPPPPRAVTKSLSFQSPKTKPPPKPPRTDIGTPSPPLRSKQISDSDRSVENNPPIYSSGDEEEYKHATGSVNAELSQQSPVLKNSKSSIKSGPNIPPRPILSRPILNAKPVPSSSPKPVPRSSPGSSPKPVPRTTPRPVPVPRSSRNIPPKPVPRTGSNPTQQLRKDQSSKRKEPVSITSVLFPNSIGSLSTATCTNNLDIIDTSSGSDEETCCNKMTTPISHHQTTPTPPHYQTVDELQQIEDSRSMGVWYDIVEHYKNKKGSSFIDPEFSPSNSSLYLIPSKPIVREGKTITNWARPNDIKNAEGSGRWCVLHNHKTADIAQGMLGNCWFLSALAVVAECPGVIDNIIVTKEWCPEGVYQIRLFKDGQWRVYIVDDYFPTFNGHLVFAQVRRKQLWVPLIEKAFAKMHGCYEAIEGGQIIEGLHALTGYPCEKFQLRGDNDSDINDTDFEYLLTRLLSFKEANYPMAAGTVSNSSTLMGFDRANLEPDHAYSILDFKQEGQDRKVRLRNPWGSGYDGVDNSGWSIWGKTTAYKGDGTFWIDVWEFYKFFKEIDICYYIPDWHCARTRVSLPPYASSHQLVFHFTVFDETQVTICINQPSERRSNITRNKNYKDLSVLVVRLPPMGEDTPTRPIPLPVECVATSQSHQLPTVTCSIFLSPGRYAILPLSFKGWYQNSSLPPSHELHDNDSPHLMAVFSSKILESNENVPTVPGFARESLFLSAKKNGKLIQSRYNVKIYSLELVPSLFMVMCENYNDSAHVDLTSNCQGSKNVSSSRNNLQCHDVLPPRHKQILLVLTRRVYAEPFKYSFSVNFQITQTNTRGGRGAMHEPPLDKVNSELHQAYPLHQGETIKISNRRDRNQVPTVDCRIS